MQTMAPLACFLSLIRPPGVQYENSLLQIAPVDKSHCPYVRDTSDIGFQLFTRHNPTVYQELVLGDDERLFASHVDWAAPTVLYFHAFMEQPEDGSAVLVREAYMQRGDSNVIMVDAHRLEAGPWYFTAAQNTWYIGRFAAQFVDYLVSRGLDLNKTHFVGHSLGAQAAGVAGAALTTGRVARLTGLDPALPLFAGLPLAQRLDPSDAEFVDVIHTDAGIFGYKEPIGHADFFPNGGRSPQPGCELEVVIPQQLLLNKFFCSHWRSYRYYAESVLQPRSFVASACPSWKDFASGRCARTRTVHMGFGIDHKAARFQHLCIRHVTLAGDGTERPRGYYTYYLRPHTHTTPPATGAHRVEPGVTGTGVGKLSKHAKYQAIAHKYKKYATKSRDTNQGDIRSVQRQYKYYTRDNRLREKRDIDSIYPDNTESPNNVQKDKQVPCTEATTTVAEYNGTQTQTVGEQTNATDRRDKTMHGTVKNSEILRRIPKLTRLFIKKWSGTANREVQSPKERSDGKKRQKRFLQMFKSDNDDSFIFKALNFLVRNRKSVVPIVSVVRDISTLVKGANGELNHVTKERNNYVGATPPELPPVTYTLELANDSKLVAFVKKLFGLTPKGNRLTIGGV